MKRGGEEEEGKERKEGEGGGERGGGEKGEREGLYKTTPPLYAFCHVSPSGMCPSSTFYMPLP